MRTTKTTKQIVKNNSKNTDSLSNADVYKTRCQNYNKLYIGEKSKNLNKRIYKHKDFKTGNTTNYFVSHKILTKHTFDFQNSAIFAFIHDKNKRRRIEACSITHHNDKVFFFKVSPSIGKISLSIKNFRPL